MKVINYINNTYIKNYKLYKYAFTPIVSYIFAKLSFNYNLNCIFNVINFIQTGIHLKIKYNNENIKNANENYRTPSPDINPFEDDINNSNLISQTASTTSTFRAKSSLTNSYEEMSPDYLKMKNYIKNILKEHLKSENVQNILDQIETDEQVLSSRPPQSRPLSKSQKKK